MKLEQLQLAAFEPLKPAAMRQVTGGVSTALGSYNGINYRSDCYDIGEGGRIHFEFYDSNGKLVGEYDSPNPCP